MRIHSNSASVVGPTSDSLWSQVITLGNSACTIEITSFNEELKTTGKKILDEITKKLREPPVSLEGVKEIVRDATSIGATSVAILVPCGTVCFLAAYNAHIYIKREDSLAILISGNGDGSVPVKAGDTFLLESETLSHLLPENEIVKVFDGLSPAQIAEKLTYMLHKKEVGVGGAGAVWRAESFIDEAEESYGSPDIYIAEATPIPTLRTIFSRGLASLRRGHIPRLSRVRYHLNQVYFRPSFSPKTIVIIVIFFFIISVIFGIRHDLVGGTDKDTLSKIAEAKRTLDEGIALRDLNPLKSRERISAAKDAFDILAKKLSPKTKAGRELKELQVQAADNLTLAMRIFSVKPEIFYDLSLLKKDARVGRMSISDDDNIAIIDTSGKTAYTVNAATKNGQILAGSQTIGVLSQVSIYSDSVYLLTNSGTYRVTISDKKATQVIKKDDGWGTISDLIAFTGNIYMLDTAKSRIWKYVATDSGFSERREYLNPDTLPDLSKAANFAIDGSVWVSTTDGNIIKFVQGKDASYVIRGVIPDLGKSLWVYTPSIATNVYVLDSEQKRVVVFDQDGAYVAQYKWGTDITASGLLVSEKLKKVFILANGLLYDFDLK
jgi:hypothetical protein